MKEVLKQQPVYVYILLVLTISATCFIWCNSVESKPASKSKSTEITEQLRPAVEPIVGKKVYGVNFVRKCAHVIEYAGLGLIVSLCVLLARLRTKRIYRLFVALGYCLLVAITDETIQVFSGRGPLVTDVLLDAAAFTVVILIVFLVCALIAKHKKKKTIEAAS